MEQPLENSTRPGIIQVSKRISKIATNIDKNTWGLRSGLAELDEALLGFHGGELIVIAGRTSIGKGQPLDRLVWTPYGAKFIGSLQIGDIIIAGDGSPTKVTGIFPQGKKKCYKVITDDGETICDENHLWLTSSRNSRSTKNPYRVLETKYMIRHLRRYNGKRANYALPRCKEVQFLEQDLPLRPYLLGVLLADGCFKEHSITITLTEKNVLEKVKNFLPQSDVLVECAGEYDNIEYRIKREQRNNKVSDTFYFIRKLGLKNLKSWEKFIPQIYLISNVEQRKELLTALLKTDGHKLKFNDNYNHKDWYEYSTTSKRLAGDVQFLVRSLGGKATITKRMGRYKRNKTYKNTRLNYRVFICLNPKPNFIQDMIYVGEKETVCIKVNHPSELYLTDDFIVTHNTSLATGIANGISELSKTLYFSLELPAKVIQERLLCQQAELNYYQIKKDGIGNSQAALMKAAKVIESRKLYIDDAPFLNPDEFSEIIEKNKIECAIVDYVQLTSSGKWNENRVKEIDVICRDLRAAAKIFNIPVILLAQLNRQVEQRKEHRPLLCDLRDSGAIEQLAQVVLLIHRPSFYEERELGLETEDTWDAELIIAKNYNGATGIVNVGFIPHSMKFVSKGEFE